MRKKTPPVEGSQIYPATALIFIVKFPRDEESTNAKEYIYAQDSVNQDGVQRSKWEEPSGPPKSVTGMTGEHHQYGDGAPAIQGGYVVPR